MQKWEYMRLVTEYDRVTKVWSWDDGGSGNVIARLNSLGAEGWELVSETPQAYIYGAGWSGYTSCVSYLFKRPHS
jgi:hypothetical protein